MGWPWIHAHGGYNGYAPNTYPAKLLNLSAVALCNNFAFHKQKIDYKKLR